MAHTTEQGSEAGRIQFLLDRDGYDATRSWVERTLRIYRQAASEAGGESLYRRGFEHSVHEFEAWLSAHPERRTDS